MRLNVRDPPLLVFSSLVDVCRTIRSEARVQLTLVPYFHAQRHAAGSLMPPR